MYSETIVFYIFLIFSGAALFATLALYARQSLLVVYILLGMLLGPSAFNLVSDPEIISNLSHIGIIFLLFLLGINLPPQKLLHMLKETTLVTSISSLLFLAIGFSVTLAFGFTHTEALIVGSAMIFSSTIIGLKLLPTTVLHHQHTGEIIISILLLQDLIAILILMLLPAQWDSVFPALKIIKLVLSLFGLIAFAYLFARYILIALLRRFNGIQEYIFLMAIGWCLWMAELASLLGLSAEIGAFIGGIVLASNPISLFIAERLKPLRDFFLIIFFFALGAGFDLSIIREILIPGSILAVIALVSKPLVFRWLLTGYGENPVSSLEVGIRLGQISEFSMFIAVLAQALDVIGPSASYLIQLSTLFTFIISSYLIILRYPTPIAVSDKLRRD